MSRIEEALRHSRSDRRRITADEAFRSPWEFEQGTERDVEYAAAPAPVPARTAAVNAPAEGLISGFSSRWRERLVVSPSADPFMVEQFRRLAATLHQAQLSSSVRTVMVTSASPGDGKTLTAINLALTLSESYGRRVLLIDADLRRPSIHDVTHLPDVLGLADGLRSKSEQKFTIFGLTPNLSLLPAGRPDPDPMASLTSDRMRRILSDACTRFDWVVLDAPPVGTVVDGSILAEMVDGALLVVRAAQTDAALTRKAVEAVGRERIFGVVLNGVAEADAPSNQYVGYYSSNRAGDREKALAAGGE